MKISIRIILILISYSALTQTPEMLDTTWYLHNLQIENVDYAPPVNSDVSFIQVDFNQVGFETGICSAANAKLENFNNNGFIANGIFFIEFDCENQESSTYEGLYFFDFYLAQFTETQFTYEILDGTDNSRSLVVTNQNGDIAFYGNTILDINSFELSQASIFPNPVINELKIETNSTIDLAAIYSITGQLVKQTATVSETSTINIEELVSGVYFLKLITQDGAVMTRKIIKE